MIEKTTTFYLFKEKLVFLQPCIPHSTQHFILFFSGYEHLYIFYAKMQSQRFFRSILWYSEI